MALLLPLAMVVLMRPLGSVVQLLVDGELGKTPKATARGEG
jgi:hypothetical protein